MPIDNCKEYGLKAGVSNKADSWSPASIKLVRKYPLILFDQISELKSDHSLPGSQRIDVAPSYSVCHIDFMGSPVMRCVFSWMPMWCDRLKLGNPSD